MKLSPSEISQYLQHENSDYRKGIIAYLQGNSELAIQCFAKAKDSQHLESSYMLGLVGEQYETQEWRDFTYASYQYAAENGHRRAKAALERLKSLQTVAVSPISVTEMQRNLLHQAVINKRHVDIDSLFLRGQIEVRGMIEALDRDGLNPFHYAVIEGDQAIINKFFDWSRRQREQVNLYQLKTKWSENIFHLAAYHGHVDLLRIWLEGEHDLFVKQEWLTTLDDFELTPLHKALSSPKEQIETLDLFIQHGARINFRGERKLSCLHHSIQHPWSDHLNIRYCLTRGANRFHSTADGDTSVELLAVSSLSLRDRQRVKDSILPMASEQRLEFGITALVFQGGGAKGAAYDGVAQALAQLDILPHVNKVGGASAGAIFAAILGIGCDEQEIREYQATDFTQFKDSSAWYHGGIFTDLARLVTQGGYYKGDFLRAWIDYIISQKLGRTNATFRDLHIRVEAYESNRANLGKNYRPRDIYIAVANTSRQQVEYWSYETEPDMAIADAVRASTAIPGVFTALSVQRDREGKLLKDANGALQLVKSEGEVIVDGGAFDNYPLKIFDKAGVPNASTLGFKLATAEQISVWRDGQSKIFANPSGFFHRFYSLGHTLLFQQQTSAHFHSADQFRTVYLDTCNVETTEFDISSQAKRDKKQKLVESAYRATRDYLLHRYETMNVIREAVPTPHEQLLRLQHLERKNIFIEKTDHMYAQVRGADYIIQLKFSLVKCKDPKKSLYKYGQKLQMQEDISRIEYATNSENHYFLRFNVSAEIYAKYLNWARKYGGYEPEKIVERDLTRLPLRDYDSMVRHIDLGMQYLYACEQGDIDRSKQLLAEGRVPVDYTDRDGNNALYYACRGDQKHIVRYLTLDQRFREFKQVNQHDHTALNVASQHLKDFIRALVSEIQARERARLSFLFDQQGQRRERSAQGKATNRRGLNIDMFSAGLIEHLEEGEGVLSSPSA